ncbi:MAG TPA: hypothetical protein VIJ39_08235 [Solirubrobacteraceae bacterium]
MTHKGELTRPFLFAGESIEDSFASSYKPDAVTDIQPTIDAASGRRNSAETIAELDTLDERTKQHLEGKRGHTTRSRPDADEPWTAPAPKVSTSPGAGSSSTPARLDCHEQGRRHSAPSHSVHAIGSRTRVRDGER